MASTYDNISQVPLFTDCPAAERELLKNLVVPLKVAAGHEVMHQGDFGTTIGVILEGRATVWRNGTHIADLGPGDCFGELALLAPPSDHGHRTASIKAESDLRVHTVSERDLNNELSDLPNVAKALRDLGQLHRQRTQ